MQRTLKRSSDIYYWIFILSFELMFSQRDLRARNVGAWVIGSGWQWMFIATLNVWLFGNDIVLHSQLSAFLALGIIALINYFGYLQRDRGLKKMEEMRRVHSASTKPIRFAAFLVWGITLAVMWGSLAFRDAGNK